MLGFLLLFFIHTSELKAALEYSKVEYPGCPENAFCQKSTGEVRQKWLEGLENFNRDKITEAKFNAELQKNDGIPVANWSLEEASVLPKIIMWDSPCKQHKKEAAKFYISEIFRKNLNPNELKDYNNLYFAKAIAIDNNKKPFSLVIPRGEFPLFSENGNYYFLREDDGKYYGFLLNREGKIGVTKVQTVKESSREVVCQKEQIDYFLREAPSPTFYQGYLCKEIWDKTSKSYRPMLFGWSCN